MATYKDAKGSDEDAVRSTEDDVQMSDPGNTAPKFPDQDLNTLGDQSDTAMRSVKENDKDANVGEPITAGDADDDKLVYRLSGPDAGSFVLGSGLEHDEVDEGQLKVDGKLDYEAQSMHTVIVTAVDPSGASDSITVTIEVTDEDDPPTISLPEAATAECNDDFECTYPENGTGPVATFAATDADGDEIDWDLDGIDKGIFKIDGGVLTFDKSPNFEGAKDGDEKPDEAGDQGKGDNVYLVTVKASSGSKAVVVTVTDVDEAGSVSFDQPQPQATRDLTASFKDEDGKDNPSWQWSRCTSKDNADDCTAIAGAMTPSRSPTADDVGSYLRATVSYTDKFDDQTASGATDNLVEERTLANTVPSFGEIDAIPVDENVKVNIGDPIVATDADNDVLLYDLDGSGADNAKFDMSKSGQLSVKKELNYELTDDGERDDAAATGADDEDDGDEVYTVMIKATDPSGAIGRTSVTVNLKDVNESPEFNKASKDQATLYIDENAANPDLYTHKSDRETADEVADYEAADDDGTTKDSAVAYTLEGADEDDFDIGGTSGELTSDSGLTANFEKKGSYSITIVATTTDPDTADDDDRGSKIGKLALTIKVVDQADVGIVMLSAREPQVEIPVVATLDDPDGGETAISWQWYRGGARATDDAERTALITTLKALEHDPDDGSTDVCTDADGANVATAADPCVVDKATSALYTPGDDDISFTLHALATYKDAKGSDEDAVRSTEDDVQMSDPGNTAPKFPDQDLNTLGDQSDTAMRSVKENDKDANVGEPITAGDADDDKLVYRLSGPDAGSFVLGSGLEHDEVDEGQLKVDGKLDYEAQSMHTVIVTAVDPSGASDSITVTIEVTDEDDPPTISLVTGPAPEPEPDHACVVGGAVTADQSANMADDCQTLLGAMAELIGDGTATLNWSAETPIGDWDGIAERDTGRVGGIFLAGDRMDGTLAGVIPANFNDLAGLERLTLRDNDLSGDIPDLSDLDNLERLSLQRNAFTGSLPDTLGDMASLDRLYIYSNEGGLTGGVPAALGNSTSLRQVWLHDNGLTGGIPAEIGDMSRLRYLILSGNMLTGEIPMEIGNATNLKQLYLNDNMLSGAIPAELGNLMTAADDTLRRLYLHNNMLTGDVPAELGNLVDLTHLRLAGNMLTGCIPAAIFGAADDMAGLEACTDDGS